MSPRGNHPEHSTFYIHREWQHIRAIHFRSLSLCSDSGKSSSSSPAIWWTITTTTKNCIFCWESQLGNRHFFFVFATPPISFELAVTMATFEADFSQFSINIIRVRVSNKRLTTTTKQINLSLIREWFI